MAAAADIAARSGVAQQAPVQTTRTRESESGRPIVYGEEHDEATGGGAAFAPAERKITRRQTRKRRKSKIEETRLRESEGRRQAVEAESAPQTEKSTRRAPLRNAEQGRKRAVNLLHQQSLLNRASIQFEQVRGPMGGATSPLGQQQAMLDNLIRMTEMLYHQHTGDKAGEIYHRPAARQILTALKGLKSGSTDEVQSEPVAPRRSKREFKAQLDRIERTQRNLEPIVMPEDYEPLDLVA